MKTIHKYPLEVADEQDVTMPVGAVILTVQVQNNQPCLWALVEPDNPTQIRTILMHGTGNPGECFWRYIATIQLHGGKLVFHVFEG
jgi:hypothetical protein